MRIILVALFFSIVFNCSANDFLNRVVRSIIKSNDAFEQTSSNIKKISSIFSDNQSSKRKTPRKNSHPKKQRTSATKANISRDELFQRRYIKTIKISPNGSRIAYITKNLGIYQVHIISTQNLNKHTKAIRENSSIKNIWFIGNENLCYSYLDDEHNAQLISVDLTTSERKNITPIDDAKSINIVASNENEFVTISNNSEKHFAHKINILDGENEQLQESDSPILSMYNSELQQTLTYEVRGDNINVFRQDKDNEDNKILIDTIKFNRARYVGANDNFAYKVYKKGQDVYLSEYNITTEKFKDIKINGASNVDQCNVIFNNKNVPLFAIENDGRVGYMALDQNIGHHITFLKKKFSDSDFRLLDMTKGSNLWLISVKNPTLSTAYYVFDTRNRHLKTIVSTDEDIRKLTLKDTKAVKIPSGQNNYIYGYLTQANNSSTKKPIVIYVNSGNGKYHSWEYIPEVQLLANRGINILCINCRPDYEEQDILTSTKWCIDKNLANRNNIIIIAKKYNAEHAFNAFVDNQSLFSGCMLLSPDIGNKAMKKSLPTLKKPLLLITKLTEDNLPERKYKNMIFIGYNEKPSNELTAGLIELFCCKRNNIDFERINRRDLGTLSIIQDTIGLIKQNMDNDDDNDEDDEDVIYDDDDD